MKKIFFVLLLLASNAHSLYAQFTLVPKLGFRTVIFDPQIDQTIIDGKLGFQVGLEGRLGQNRITFNPGLFFNYESVDLLAVDTLQSPITQTKVGSAGNNYLSAPLIMGMYLTSRDRPVSLRFRVGFVPSVRLGTPDYENTPLTSDDARPVLLDLLFGLGLDLGKIVFDVNYDIRFLTGLKNASNVHNNFTISMGYQL